MPNQLNLIFGERRTRVPGVTLGARDLAQGYRLASVTPFTDEVPCAAATSTAQASLEKRQVSIEPIQARSVRDTPTHFLSDAQVHRKDRPASA
jgi:hypothetical protein